MRAFWCAAAGFGVLIGLGTGSPARAADGKPSAVERVLTAETAGFIHLRVAEVWNSDAAQLLRKYVAQAGPEALSGFDARFAPNPSDIESLTVVIPDVKFRDLLPRGHPTATSAVWVVTTKKPIDRVELIRALGREGRSKRHGSSQYYFNDTDWSGVLLLDDRTLVYAAEDTLTKVIDGIPAPGADPTPLAALFRAEADKHVATVGVNVATLLQPEVLRDVPEELHALFKARTWAAHLDLTPATRLSVVVDFPSPELAKAGEKAARAGLALARSEIQKGLAYLEEKLKPAPGAPPAGIQDFPQKVGLLLAVAGLRQLDTMLKDLPIEVKGATARASLDLDPLLPGGATAATVATVFASIVYSLEETRDRSYYGVKDSQYEMEMRERSLKQIADAIEKYRKDKGHYPPAAITGPGGEPLLSWRVAILPYLDESVYIPAAPGEYNGAKSDKGPPRTTPAELYRQFDLTQPWHGPTNKKLIERMPSVLQGRYYYYGGRPGQTTVMAVVGKDTIFSPRDRVRMEDVTDGTANTVLVINFQQPTQSVFWTKPADVVLTDDGKLPATGPKLDQNMVVVFADGGARTYPVGMSEKLFRSILTRNGGETVNPAEIRPVPPKGSGNEKSPFPSPPPK